MVIRLLLVLLTVLTFHGTAFAHGALERATPKPGSVVKTAPAQVTLRFNEKLEPKFSTVEVINASGERMDAAPAQVKSGTTLEVALKPVPAGTYTVNWQVVSMDIHTTSGSFTFEVRP
ncbi:MAG: copper resistance protein CopC [Rhodospirillaceae bacterium]|nr:copper resistance protein CopC [Rhodospirillales bacterium]